MAALPEWPILIQDAVVDTPHSGDPAGVCRLKYDRKVGGEDYHSHDSSAHASLLGRQCADDLN